MPIDDHDFMGLLSAIPSDVKRYSQDVADYSRELAESIERHFDTVAASIRQTLQATPWIPECIKPPSPPTRRPSPQMPSSYIESTQLWVSKNRKLSAIILVFLSTGALVIWHNRRHRHKRRAKRAPNGARTEVVILAGSPQSPLTRTIGLDLERRGFIVYIPVSTLSEEQTIRSESRADIHPLNVDITSPTATAEALSKFSAHLENPPRYGSAYHHSIRLASIILLPTYPSTHPTGPVTSLPPSAWSEVLNTHLLYPLSLLHAFLPLLLQPSTTPKSPTLLFLTPTLPSALHTPYQAPESLISTALVSYFRTLRAEVPQANLTITTIKLGIFDFHDGFPLRTQTATLRSIRNRSPDSKDPRGGGSNNIPPRSTLFDIIRSYIFSPSSFRKGSHLRELHNDVFDAVVGRRRGTVFVGKGSRAYDLVGRWMSSGLVGWMLSRRVGCGGRLDDVSREWEQVEGMGGTFVYA